MTKFDIKNNELYQAFLDKKTIFGLKAAKNHQEVENYFNWLQEIFPSLDKQKLSNELQGKFASLDESAKINLGLKNILRDEESVAKAKKEIYQQLDQLPSNEELLFYIKPETVELLKEKINRDLAFQRIDNLAFWFKFYYQELLLNYLPQELQKELGSELKLIFYKMNHEQKQRWDSWHNELLKKTVDYFDNLESDSSLQEVNKKVESIYTELTEIINYSREEKRDLSEGFSRRQVRQTNNRLLKDIPADQWDKIKINNPWLNHSNSNSLIRKIVNSSTLTNGNFLFTQLGLDKIKTFVDNDWMFGLYRGGTLPLKSLTTSHDIDASINGLSKYDNIGKALEEGQIMRAGKFVSREAFDFMAWMMGNQEVDYQRVERSRPWEDFKEWLEADGSRTSWQKELNWGNLWNFFAAGNNWKEYVDREGDYNVELEPQNAQGLKKTFLEWQAGRKGPESKVILNTPKNTIPAISEVVDLRHIKSLSSEVKNALKGKRVSLNENLLYRKLVKDINPQNWDAVQFYYNSVAPHNISPFTLRAENPYGNTSGLISDYSQWVNAYPTRSKWNTNQLFRTGGSGGTYYVCANQGVLYYLQEKFGEKEASIFYNATNNNLPNEYLVDEFFNDNNLAAAIANNSSNRTASLSVGSGQLLYVGDLTRKQRKELENREGIVWDQVRNHKKLWKHVISSNLDDLRIPLHSFDVLVTKARETDEEKTKLDKANERLLTADNRFANQAILDEFKTVVNLANCWFIPVNGSQRIPLENLTVNDQLQGGYTYTIPEKASSGSYVSINAYESVIGYLFSNNTQFKNNQGNYTPAGLDFLKKIIKSEDWEKIEARVDYRKDKKLSLKEFVNDDIDQDIRLFLIDENKTAGMSQTGQATIDTSSLEEKLNNILGQQENIDNLFNQLNQAQQATFNQLTQQLLAVKRESLEQRVVSFGKEVNINTGHLQREYSSTSYKKALEENLTLNNEQLLEDTLKAVIGLCATNQSQRRSDNLSQDEDDLSIKEIEGLLAYLEKVKIAWGKISTDIPSHNNLLYLQKISKQAELRTKVQELITTWKQKLEQEKSKRQQQEQIAQIQVNPNQGGNN